MKAARARKERLCQLWMERPGDPPHCTASKRRTGKKEYRSRPGSVWSIQSIRKELSLLEEGTLPQPPLPDLARILQTCRKHQDRPLAIRLHGYMQKIGLEAHALLGNYLVPMLVDVGCIRDAQRLFDRLLHINQWSWDSLIFGYVNHGKPQNALLLYQRMPKDGSLQPLGPTFVSLLRACVELKDLERGLEIHADVAKRGLLRRDLFVGSALVDLYAKSGSLMKAQQVFDSLPTKDVVCWTALVAGYAEHGCGQEALHFFEEMQLQNFCPDAVTFVCALKACASTGIIASGEVIHAEIERRGLLESNILVGNALVNTYAKCGSLEKAQEVFNKLPKRDVVSWTALIGGYTENGHGEKALFFFEQMQRDGVLPNSVTYVCILKACGSIGALKRGQQTHSRIEKLGFLEKDLILGNTLVDMYARCGSLTQSREVFDRLAARNAVSWATLIVGHTEQGYGDEALELFDQMRVEGISPDDITFVSSLKACAITGAAEKGQKIHVEIERQGLLVGNLVIGNALVDMYAKCGSLTTAKQVFNVLSVRDVVSWTALISGYADHGHFEEAMKGFEQMQLVGVSPNVVTFVCVLKACSSARATDKGQEIFADISRYGSLERDLIIGNTVVDVYAKGGLLVMAKQLFNRLPVRTVVSWSSLISGYAEHGCSEEAIHFFQQMQLEGFSPDTATFVCCLKACCSMGALNKGQELHAEIERRGLLGRDLIGNTLITMYANCGLLVKAQEVFDKLPFRDVVSWTALMAGYAQAGDSENVFYSFDRLLGEGLKPDPITFLVVLNACSRRGLFDKSQTFFVAMSKDHGLTPALEHHICLVDLLVRSGQLGEAKAMIMRMAECSSLVMWNAVLNSCRSWGNVQFAEQAFDHAIHLNDQNAVAYAAMSHIHEGIFFNGEMKKFKASRAQL